MPLLVKANNHEDYPSLIRFIIGAGEEIAEVADEFIACLRGRFVIEFYDELERICSESIELSPNGEVVAINVPAGQWHSLRCLEPNTVLLESKDGAWEPLSEVDVLRL